jgi:hypothetical protein
MPLLDAVRRLTTVGSVPLESSDALAVAVGAASPYAVRPVPELYSGPTGYGGLPTTPLQLLEALGGVTAGPLTPDYELLVAAGSWAILRYLWAFDDPHRGSTELRTHAVTGKVRHHRRQLFSEDFGIAVAARALAEHLWINGRPPPLLDADMVVDDLAAIGAIVHTGPRRPDYLGWLHHDAGTTLVVVECKGCSSSRAGSIQQLRAGLEQAVSVRGVGIPTRHFVVGSVVTRNTWRLFAHAIEVRPPRESLLSGRGPAPDEIDEVFRRGDDARLLRLVGAHAEASRRLGRGEPEGITARELQLGGERYRGTLLPAPATDGVATLAVGLRDAVFAAAREGRPRELEPLLLERARSFGSLDDWFFQGSDEPLPLRFVTEEWEEVAGSRDRSKVLEERRTLQMPAASWAITEGEHSVVETLDGVRVEVTPEPAEAFRGVAAES